MHRLAAEDAAVRVVDVRLAPRSSERPHTHALPSLMVVDRPTPLAVRLVDARGRPHLVFERTRQPRRGRGLEIQWLEPEPFHFVENTSDCEYRALRFEWKAPPPRLPLASAPRLAPGSPPARLVLATGGVTVWRMRLHTSTRATLGVEAAGAWLLSAAGAACTLGARAGQITPLVFGPGRPLLWPLEPGTSYQLTRRGPGAPPLWLIAHGHVVSPLVAHDAT